MENQDPKFESLQDYVNWLHGGPNVDELEKENRGLDVIFIKYTPRWKWFKPPRWFIFKWAYKVQEITKFENCYPRKVDLGGEKLEDGVPISFTVTKHESPEINKIAEDLKKRMEENYE